MGARRSRFRQALGFLPAALALGLARLLPWRARLEFGGWLGRIAVVRLPRFRARVNANLAHVFPEFGAAARADLAKAVGDSFGRTFVEIFDLQGFEDARTWTGPTGAGVAALEAAARSGRGAVVVTGHLGQWEAGRAWLKSIGIVCAGLYRPLNNAPLNAIYERNLEIGGTPMFPKSPRGLRRLVGHVAKGGVVAILTDQYERRAAPFDFIGKSAPTTTFVADLALKYGVPLIPAYGVRDPDGVHVAVVIEDPIPRTTPAEMTQAVNDSLAARVRATPGQYFWVHLRWEKRLPGL